MFNRVKKHNEEKSLLFLVIASLCLFVGINVLLVANQLYSRNFFSPNTFKIIKRIEQPIYPEPLTPPTKVKGIYLTGYSFTAKKARGNLTKLIENTELNAMVIDIKDPGNKPIFYSQNKKLKEIPLSNVALDNEIIKSILRDLQSRGIYTIARLTTFQDNHAATHLPHLALKNKSGTTWKNWQGITWLDMTNPDAWEIPILFAKEAASLGFDEVQFDYIRFPSDGNVKQISYYNLPASQKKYQAIDKFYQYMSAELKDVPIYTSVDLFGLTYQRHNNLDYDLNIGQRLVDAAKYFDFISPMVYPSHYPTGFLGFNNPADHPYEVVYKAMSEGNAIISAATTSIAQSRPWLQDFNLGAVYDTAMVQAQIQASDENNTAGWLLWNSSNRYTTEALDN